MDPIEQIRQSIERNKQKRRLEAENLAEGIAKGREEYEPLIQTLDALELMDVKIQIPSLGEYSGYRVSAPGVMHLEFSRHSADIRKIINSYSIFGLGYSTISCKSLTELIDAVVGYVMDYSDLEERIVVIMQESEASGLSPALGEAISGLAPVLARVGDRTP